MAWVDAAKAEWPWLPAVLRQCGILFFFIMIHIII